VIILRKIYDPLLPDVDTLAGNELESMDRVVAKLSTWRKIKDWIIKLFRRKEIYGIDRAPGEWLDEETEGC
jgi:hypothetical protein